MTNRITHLYVLVVALGFAMGASIAIIGGSAEAAPTCAGICAPLPETTDAR